MAKPHFSADPGAHTHRPQWFQCLAVLTVSLLLEAMANSLLAALDDAELDFEPELPAEMEAASVDSAEAALVRPHPLNAAIRQHDAEQVNQLLAAGADANAPDRFGTTPLMTACREYRRLRRAKTAERQANCTILTALLTAGADPNARMLDSDQPLLLYVRRSAPETDVFKAMLEHGADPNLRWRDKPLLHHLLFQTHLEFAELLIDHGADLNAVFRMGFVMDEQLAGTDLHLAVLTQVSDDALSPTAELLLQRGAAVNIPDSAGQTPLHLAVYYGKTSMVQVLLAHGADGSIRDHDGNLALTLAHPGLELAALEAATPTATAEDIRRALERGSFSGAGALHRVATAYSSPLWFIGWVLAMTAAVMLVWKRGRAMQVAQAGATVARRRAKAGNRGSESAATDDFTPGPVAPTLTAAAAAIHGGDSSRRAQRARRDLLAVRLERLRRRFLRTRLYAWLPLTAWAICWGLFFFDPYLRAEGLLPNLVTLGIGLVLAGVTANLFARSERGRSAVAVLGMLLSVGAAVWGLYWCRLFFHLQDLAVAFIFLWTAAGALGLAAVFWNSFNVHFTLWRLGRKRAPAKLTAADEIEIGAGWDLGGAEER